MSNSRSLWVNFERVLESSTQDVWSSVVSILILSLPSLGDLHSILSVSEHQQTPSSSHAHHFHVMLTAFEDFSIVHHCIEFRETHTWCPSTQSQYSPPPSDVAQHWRPINLHYRQFCFKNTAPLKCPFSRSNHGSYPWGPWRWRAAILSCGRRGDQVGYWEIHQKLSAGKKHP